MPRSHFQFRLRTLFVVVTAWAVLLAQWPWIEYAPPAFVQLSGWDRYGIAAGYHFVPTRVIAVASIEAAALIGWLVWRRVRQRGCTQS